MPFFDFKCQSCDEIHEAFLTRYDNPPPVCPKCGVITRRIFTVAWTSGDKPTIIPGCDCHNINSDRYNHPDRPNPARGWYQFAHKCENAEIEGKTPKLHGDNVHLSIEAWKRAGYGL
jgi:putative FmdB family regulatory protein